MKYIELALGRPSNRGIIIPLEDFAGAVKNARSKGMELYRSYYLYDEEVLEHMKIRKTVKGYKGKYYVDKLIFDIDKGSDSDDFVRNRVKAFFEKLVDDWKLSENMIGIWFSGRGYHITTPDIFGFEASNYMPLEVKNTLTQYFNEADDIYDGARILRAGYTINMKSKMFKVQITPEELFHLTTEELFTIAKDTKIRRLPKIDDGETGEIPNYQDLIMKGVVQRVNETVAHEPNRIVTCMQRLFDEGSRNGQRHIKLLRLVSTWRRQGVARQAIERLAQIWADTLEPYEVHRIVNSVFDKGYTFGCADAIMSQYCDPKCIYFKGKDFVMEVQDSLKMEENYSKFINEGIKTGSFDLNDIYDIGHSHLIVPEDFIVMWADTGMNKTALAQNIAVKLKHMRILYLTLEFSSNLLFRRFLQIENEMTKEEIDQYYQSGRKGLAQSISNIKVIDVAPDMTGIRKLIAQENPQLVILDTLGDMQMERLLDSTGQTEELGKQLKKLCQSTKIIMLAIHHISKHGAEDDKGNSKSLTAHSGKGGSSVEQKADEVWGIEGSRDAQYRRFKSLKVRDRNPFDIGLQFNPENFVMKQMFT